MYRGLRSKLSSLVARQGKILKRQSALPDFDRRQAELQADIDVLSRQIAEERAKVRERDAAKRSEKARNAKAKIERRHKPKS